MRPDSPAPGDPAEIQQILFGFTGVLAWDVGGNWGDVAERLARGFKRVISFEPADESYQILLETAATTPGVEAVQMAISDHDGDVLLDVQENSIRSGQLTTASPGDTPDSLSESTWGKVLERRPVTCSRLDSLGERYGVPDFIKIDVEGHEVAVIEGGLNLLKTATPCLFIEIHNALLGTRIEELLGPIYGEHLRVVRHPHYPQGSWGRDNHYYLIADLSWTEPAAPLAPPAISTPRKGFTVSNVRDVEAAYREAHLDEYRSYVAAGRMEDAAYVAGVLKSQFGVDVEAKAEKPKREPEAEAPERADEEKPPEAAVEPKPRRGGRTKLPRDDKGNIIRETK
jgi:FkbM family methyltransferase